MWKIPIQMLVGIGAMILGSQLTTAAPKEAGHPNVDQIKGKRIFLKHCAGCHGSEGKGDGYRLLGPDPANLTRSVTKHKSDATLLRAIHEGRPNMPSWKGRLSEDESRAVLAYIRSLKT